MATATSTPSKLFQLKEIDEPDELDGVCYKINGFSNEGLVVFVNGPLCVIYWIQIPRGFKVDEKCRRE